MRRFNAILALYDLTDKAWGRVEVSRDYKKMLTLVLEVDVGELNALAEKLHTRGATSRLIEDPPFIVTIDRDKLVETLSEELAKLEEEILKTELATTSTDSS